MRSEGILPDGRIPGAAVHEYLTEYATRFGLLDRIRLNTWIERIEREPAAVGGGGAARWGFEVANITDRLQARKLIVATGLTSEPFMPFLPGREEFEGEVLHSKVLGDPHTGSRLADKSIRHAVVYRGSKSAFDTVYLLLRAGNTMDWVIREGGGGPSIMTPLSILGQPSFRLNNRRVLTLFSPYPFATSMEPSWWQQIMHQRAGPLAQFVVVTFWRVMAYLLLRPWKYEQSANGHRLKPLLGVDSLLWSPATLGVMTNPELWQYIHTAKGITIHRRAIKALQKDKCVVLDNGNEISADLVVCATGWYARPSLFAPDGRLAMGLPSSSSFDLKSGARWLDLQATADQEIIEELPILQKNPLPPPPARCEDDYHLYRFIAPSNEAPSHERSIAYVGFLRTTGALIVYEAQSLWAAAYLTGALKVADQEEREREVSRTNAWIRRRYVCGRKVPFALFDFLPYVDMLYRDLGVSSNRKANAVAEVFGLYRPRDFTGVVSVAE